MRPSGHGNERVVERKDKNLRNETEKKRQKHHLLKAEMPWDCFWVGEITFQDSRGSTRGTTVGAHLSAVPACIPYTWVTRDVIPRGTTSQVTPPRFPPYLSSTAGPVPFVLLSVGYTQSKKHPDSPAHTHHMRRNARAEEGQMGLQEKNALRGRPLRT